MKQSEADTLKGMIDIMAGDNAYDCMKSQANVIKAKNKQINFLKSEMAKADMGHSEMADTIQELKATKERYECLIGSLKEKVDKLEPEIDKSCDDYKGRVYAPCD